MIEDGNEHDIVATSIVTSSKPSATSCSCQIHAYFSHEKKPIHLLNLDPFPKESHETEVEYKVVTPSIFSSSESLEFFVMLH